MMTISAKTVDTVRKRERELHFSKQKCSDFKWQKNKQ